MVRAKLIVFIATAMVFAQLQCVSACVGNWCGLDFGKSQSVPPCHRHHDHSHDQTPASCSHQFTNPPAAARDLLHMQAPAMVALGPVTKLAGAIGPSTRSSELGPAEFSPPESVRTAPTVLRI
jgi:hypothetical protein